MKSTPYALIIRAAVPTMVASWVMGAAIALLASGKGMFTLMAVTFALAMASTLAIPMFAWLAYNALLRDAHDLQPDTSHCERYLLNVLNTTWTYIPPEVRPGVILALEALAADNGYVSPRRLLNRSARMLEGCLLEPDGDRMAIAILALLQHNCAGHLLPNIQRIERGELGADRFPEVRRKAMECSASIQSLGSVPR